MSPKSRGGKKIIKYQKDNKPDRNQEEMSPSTDCLLFYGLTHQNSHLFLAKEAREHCRKRKSHGQSINKSSIGRKHHKIGNLVSAFATSLRGRDVTDASWEKHVFELSPAVFHYPVFYFWRVVYAGDYLVCIVSCFSKYAMHRGFLAVREIIGEFGGNRCSKCLPKTSFARYLRPKDWYDLLLLQVYLAFLTNIWYIMFSAVVIRDVISESREKQKFQLSNCDFLFSLFSIRTFYNLS